MKFRDASGYALGNTTFMPYDGYFGPDVDTMAYLERMLEDPSSGMDKPAAVIVETVQGEGGVNVATLRWLKEREKLSAAAAPVRSSASRPPASVRTSSHCRSRCPVSGCRCRWC
ncbi:hypothetical protein G6F56_014149 [Rhizopus delemar]|nr:hypothetical protein G6F56_014149 [Rhizopus delemar]